MGRRITPDAVGPAAQVVTLAHVTIPISQRSSVLMRQRGRSAAGAARVNTELDDGNIAPRALATEYA